MYGFFATDPTKPNHLSKPEQNLFEYLQEDLEKHTNYLSELYEHTFRAEEAPAVEPAPVVGVVDDSMQDYIMSLVETGVVKQAPQAPAVVEKKLPQKAMEEEHAEFKEWKAKVRNYTKACLQFLDNLNEGIANGLIGEK